MWGLYTLLLATIGCSHAVNQKSQIVSYPELISVYVGQAVMMKCQIFNPMDSVMSWSSVTYNFKIFQGSRKLINDATNRYSVKSIAGGQMYYLQILYVEKSDQGFYKCAIEGTDQQMITQLNVLDRPNFLLSEESPLNLTDCCLAEGVSQSCLPVCTPGQIDLQKFNLTANCGTLKNLMGLSKCFTGGSNSDNCCLNMKVDAQCLGICHNDVSKNASMEYFNRCYGNKIIKEIFGCFETSFESLPSEPTNVSAMAVCMANSEMILVKWSEPNKNPKVVTGYKVMYKSEMQEIYSTVLIKSPRDTYFLLTIEENMITSGVNYKIHVSALADHGVSFESVEVDVYVPNCTLPDKSNTSFIAEPTNLIATCNGKTVAVLLTWDMESNLSYSGFIVFYKSLNAVQYTVASNVTTLFYQLTNLKPLTDYTAYVVAQGDESSFSQPSLNVNFKTGSVTSITTTEGTHKQADYNDDFEENNKIAIGVGVTLSVVFLIVIILLVIFFIYKIRLLPAGMKASMTFDNPEFQGSQKF